MDALGREIIEKTAWLYVKVWETRLCFIDYWSFAHFWSGFVVFTILLCRGVRRRFLVCATLLLLYELIELAFIYGAFHVFRPESLADQVTDIVVGIVGAWCAGKWAAILVGSRPSRETGKIPWHEASLTAGFVSVTVAFLWVGFYGYRYNTPALNSPGLNWWAFTLWSAAHFTVIFIFVRRNTGSRGVLQGGATAWIIHLAGLFCIEYFGFHVLGIREIGRAYRRPLIADILHGSLITFLYYTTAPLMTILLFDRFERLFRKAAEVAADSQSISRQPDVPVIDTLPRAGGRPIGRTAAHAGE